GQQMQVLSKVEGEFGYQLYIGQDGFVNFRIKTNTGILVIKSKNKIFVDENWHHIEAVWDSSAGIYNSHLAVDRVVAWSAPELGVLTDTQGPLSIGGIYRAENNIGQRFCGHIDNVRISVDRPELLSVSGLPLSDPAVMTGTHLTNQPGFLNMRFVYDPPVTPECHAGTLAQRSDGAIVAAWFGGTHEGHIDVGIWQSVFDGTNWAIPHEVGHGTYSNGTPSATFNPVLFQYPANGPMLLFYMGGTLDKLLGTLQTSQDGGQAWSAPVRLPGTIRGATKNKPVLLADGTLLCPDNSGRLKFDRTRDYGQTWLASAYTPYGAISAIQPTILTYPGGRLQALARSQTGAVITTRSSDNGLTWSALESTSLPNNNSGIDAATLADGRQLLVYNHQGIPAGSWGGPRTPLNIAVSEDGISWQAALVLEDEPGEYSYPAVIQSADGLVHILYTWNRLRMKHVVIDPAAFELRPITSGVWPVQ
ncbi:MAG: exo-alpha-sialidase, partial [Kiritimatiellales bacterium]